MVFTRFSIIFLLAILLAPFSAQAAVLAPDQQIWLDKKNNTIIVRPEKSYPPFSFVSSSPSIKPKGLAVDYLDLIARKIGAQPRYLEAKSRSNILADLKAGKEGIVMALSEDREDADSFYFSEPFITIPAVIVTRRDYKKGSKELTLADFNAKQVAITSDYAVSDYIINNYPRIIVEHVTDDEVGLQKLLLAEVDAAVMDLASLSYYTSRDILSYVTIAGQTGFDYNLAFAVPKNMPDLQVILNAGLKEITPSEKLVIKDRWITFPSVQENTDKKLSFLSVGTPLWMGASVLGGIIIIILLTGIIIHTRKHHSLHIASVIKKKEKDNKINELTNQFKELEDSKSLIKDELSHIDELEKEIKDKLENIS
ncbi:MAG: transporter substrate-binding domain-containing protein [Candidatus Pacebacteria bacterium]|nr:transporter substrate-binding domain-containing protein [Candidatus Paceibacterota bacterium]